MYLRDIEEQPQPGSYREAIKMMQDEGSEYPQIWHLFAFLPTATEHLARFTQEIMRQCCNFRAAAHERYDAEVAFRLQSGTAQR